MTAVVLALLAATTFGSADFFGGLAARHAPVHSVLFFSQLASLVPLIIALCLLPAPHPTTADWAWGAAAGAIAVAGMTLLYVAMSAGSMTLVAPVTAVCAAVLPAIAGLLLGARLPRAAWAGLALGVCAVAMISFQKAVPGEAASSSQVSPARTITIAIGAGACIGGFFIVLSRCTQGSGMTPLLAMRAVTLAAFGSIVAVRRRRSSRTRQWLVPRGFRAAAVAAGVLDMTGNGLYLAAVQGGSLPVIAVIASLYPAATVALARIALRERATRIQAVGIGAGLAAVALLTVTRRGAP